MPFTASHIAAVLPLRRRWRLIFPALVIGSMAPDIEYFLTLSPTSRVFHTFPGLLYYTLPAAFIALWIYEVFLRDPVFDLLPESFRQRISAERVSFTGFSNLAAIFASFVIGIATHLAWDAFTHEDTVITDRWLWLDRNVAVPALGPHTVYKWLQYLSSAIGLALIAVAVVVWFLRTKPSTSLARSPYDGIQKLLIWVLLAASSFVAAGVHTYLYIQKQFPFTRVGLILTLIAATTVFFWEVLAFSVLVQARRQWKMNIRGTRAADPTV